MLKAKAPKADEKGGAEAAGAGKVGAKGKGDKAAKGDKKKKKKKKDETVYGATIKPAIGKEIVECAGEGRLDDVYFCKCCQVTISDNAARKAHVDGGRHGAASGRIIFSERFQYEQRERPKPTPAPETALPAVVELPKIDTKKAAAKAAKDAKAAKAAESAAKKKGGKKSEGQPKGPTGPTTPRPPAWATEPLSQDRHMEFVEVARRGIATICNEHCDPFGCVNGKNYEKWLGLGIIAAAKNGHGKLLRALYNYGGPKLKPDFPDPEANESTALHSACALGYLSDCVTFLIEKGANINAKKLNGFTPLHVAAEGTCEKLVSHLNFHGATIDEPSRRGFTPLHVAAMLGNPSMVRLLLSFKANPMARVDNGATPLHLASMRGNVDVAKILIKAGADVNAMIPAPSLEGIPGDGYNEITPIQLAFGRNDAATVRLLLAMGADQRQAYKLKHEAEDALQAAEEQRLEDLRLAAA